MKNHYDPDSPHAANCNNDKLTLHLKEEQLDISKKLIKTGEVIAYKETYTKEKTFTVPITYENLVIEKKNFKDKNSDVINNNSETICIPLSEEQVDIKKHKVILEDVNIYKQQLADNKHIEETLKKEKLYLKTHENANLADTDLDSLS